MMYRTPPTITDIAAAADVSRFTVSLALRNSPRVAAPTREKMQAEAARLGYRPNPTLAALMRSIRTKTRGERKTTLGIVVAMEAPDWKGRHRYIHDICKGAQARAEELGYHMDLFTWPKSKQPGRRLQQIITARNIDGLVIAPLPQLGFKLGLDFTRLSYVAIGHTLTDVAANSVQTASFNNMRTVMEAAVTRGWRRPGIILHQRLNNAVESRLLGAYLAYVHEHLGGLIVPPMLCDESEWTADRVVGWVKKYKVNAVIGSRTVLKDWLSEAGHVIGRDLAFAHLDCPSGSGVLAGVDQRHGEIGATAVDMLGEQLQANQRGIPRIPKVVSINGVWHDGPTMPQRRVATKA